MKNILFFLTLLIFTISCKKDIITAPQTFPIEKTKNWMQNLIKKFHTKTITLKNICMPKAHDAGMFEVNECYAGNECNTKTQELNMTEMLESGIRVFDVRPVLKDGIYWTYHKTECGGFGCDGVLLETFCEQTKSYLENHNELVIFEFDHFCDVTPTTTDFLDFLSTVFGNLIYTETQAQSENIINRPLQDILSESNTSGKILLLMTDLNTSTEDRSQGFFARSYMPKVGSYANKNNLNEMESNQKIKFTNFIEANTSLFNLYWTVTQSDAQAVDCFNSDPKPESIKDITVETSKQLAEKIRSWMDENLITKTKIPNIISIDFANTKVTEQCILLSEFSLN